MKELSFGGIEGATIKLLDSDANEYSLELTDELRDALRRANAEVARALDETGGDLKPRDVQALVRSGVAPEDIAQAADLDPEWVDRYARPVLDERAYIAARARELPISHEEGAPLLGDIALDRLATRGVIADAMIWDAVHEDGRWVVSLVFSSAQGGAEARWAVDVKARTLEALDDEARWISVPGQDGPIPSAAPATIRRLKAVPDEPAGDDATDSAGPDPAEGGITPAALLDDLMAHRGLRQPVDEDGFDDGLGRRPGAPHLHSVGNPPEPHASTSRPDANVVPLIPPAKAPELAAPADATPAPEAAPPTPPQDDQAGTPEAQPTTAMNATELRDALDSGLLLDESEVGRVPSPNTTTGHRLRDANLGAPGDGSHRSAAEAKAAANADALFDVTPPEASELGDDATVFTEPPLLPELVPEPVEEEERPPAAPPRPRGGRRGREERRTVADRADADAQQDAAEAAADGADADATKTKKPKRPARNHRASVPSWDEIVFGAKPEN
ncbi:MAG: DUF3071 domain-containing protein [Bifidobacteriaceae bacterium]|jgi:hypothetical protein|nr:DUF3071 domain-containing protein [Bifidobacteriaceae bacterium]